MNNRAMKLLRQLQRAALLRPERPNTWWTAVEADDRPAVAQLVAAKLAEVQGAHFGKHLYVRLSEEGAGKLEA